MKPREAPSIAITRTRDGMTVGTGSTRLTGGRTAVSPRPRSQRGPATEATIATSAKTPADVRERAERLRETAERDAQQREHEDAA